MTAGPGSGKTAVMRERAIRKLRRDPLVRGIAVTFTRDAASELEGRIMTAYPEGAGRMTCGTFHSLCKRQLEEAGFRVDLVNDNQQMDLVRRAWLETTEGAGKITLEHARAFIDEMKSRVHPDLGDVEQCTLTVIYLRYQEKLRQIGRMDFADMLVMATQMMATGQVKPIPGDFLLVDESQDTDPVQMGWVYAYMSKGVEVCIVGDDDQSIYSFRFASGYKSMEEFRNKARATHINLDTSYRCAHEILAPASRLIEHNNERIPKQLRTQNPSRGQVLRAVAVNRDDEIRQLVELVEKTGSPSDWGILARTNKLLEAVEKGVASRFPVTRKGKGSFWDLRCPSLLLGLTRSLWFDDMVGVDAILRLAGVEERRITQIHAMAQSQHKGSLSAFLKDTDSAGDDDPVAYFRKRAREWLNLMRRDNIPLATRGMVHYFEERLQLIEPGTRDRGAAAKKNHDLLVASACAIANAYWDEVPGGAGTSAAPTGAASKPSPAAVTRVASTMPALASSDGSPSPGGDTPSKSRKATTAKTLGYRLIQLTREQDPQADESAPAAARLMTLHGSKGLEFKYVWMLGCEEGVIPAKGAPTEEERRLFYVGMTRAKQLLVISHAGAPSPFIAECGPLG